MRAINPSLLLLEQCCDAHVEQADNGRKKMLPMQNNVSKLNTDKEVLFENHVIWNHIQDF